MQAASSSPWEGSRQAGSCRRGDPAEVLSASWVDSLSLWVLELEIC